MVFSRIRFWNTSGTSLATGGYTTTYVAATEEWTATISTFQQENLGQVFYNSTANAFKVTKQSVSGGTWASGVALPTAIKGFASAGTQTAAIAAGGENEPGDKLTSTFEYDGSSWTTGGNLNAGKRENTGAGTQTAALSMGGDLPPYTGQTEEYNGSSWSEQNDLATARGAAAGMGQTQQNNMMEPIGLQVEI
jgi:hypothetical protein